MAFNEHALSSSQMCRLFATFGAYLPPHAPLSTPPPPSLCVRRHSILLPSFFHSSFILSLSPRGHPRHRRPRRHRCHLDVTADAAPALPTTALPAVALASAVAAAFFAADTAADTAPAAADFFTAEKTNIKFNSSQEGHFC